MFPCQWQESKITDCMWNYPNNIFRIQYVFFVLVVCCACNLLYTISPQTCYHASTAPYTYHREWTFPVSGMFIAFIGIINRICLHIMWEETINISTSCWFVLCNVMLPSCCGASWEFLWIRIVYMENGGCYSWGVVLIHLDKLSSTII